MHLRRLQLTGFRNYRELDLQLAPGRLLFLGDNAQGKSNLLEAVQLLAGGRSVRAGNDGEMIGWDPESEGQAFARLQGSIERRAGPVQLEALVVGPAPAGSPGPSRAGKRFRVNGIPRRGIDFVGQLRSVLFTADDLEIISGPPAGRRLFLDAALTQLDRAYYAASQRYARVLQQRNATLRRIREGVAGPDELLLWDDTLTHQGAVIIAGRAQAVGRLAGLTAAAHRELSGAVEELGVRYEPQLGDDWRDLVPADATPSSVQPVFAAALAAQRRRDIAAGLSLVGPHRDDVSILLNGVAAAAFGSRAQIRTAALALRLAEARLLLAGSADPPVLLLDDIVSELDERRRRAALAGIADFEQVWFTATSDSWLPDDFVAGATVYRVANGSIVPA